MAETKRCPNCGATNPKRAEWCNQCLERFAEMPDALGEEEEESGADEPPSARAAGEPAVVPPAPSETRFRQTEEGIVWICSRCDNDNPLELAVCTVCGTTFADSIRPRAERPQRDPVTAALLSLLLPGAGHAYLGQWSQAVARGVLSVWVMLVVVSGIFFRDIPGSGVLALSFGAVAFGLWAVTAHDAYREARDEARMALLKGRMFLYLVLGLLGLLFVVILGAGFSARGS